MIKSAASILEDKGFLGGVIHGGGVECLLVHIVSQLTSLTFSPRHTCPLGGHSHPMLEAHTDALEWLWTDVTVIAGFGW